MPSKAPKKRPADGEVAPQPRRKAVEASKRSRPSALLSVATPPSFSSPPLLDAVRSSLAAEGPPVGVAGHSSTAAASPSASPRAGPNLPTLEGLDQLCAEGEFDLADSKYLATTRADVDVDPNLAAYAEAELERVGQEAWQVWNSTRPVNTQKTYAKGKRVWYEWCRLRGFRDGPLVRELKLVLWLKEYVLRLTTTHRKRGVNRPSRLLEGEGTAGQHREAAENSKDGETGKVSSHHFDPFFWLGEGVGGAQRPGGGTAAAFYDFSGSFVAPPSQGKGWSV